MLKFPQFANDRSFQKLCELLVQIDYIGVSTDTVEPSNNQVVLKFTDPSQVQQFYDLVSEIPTVEDIENEDWEPVLHRPYIGA